jgi:glycine dehydrogenase subunit 2
MIEPTVYELSSPGRHGPLLPVLDVPLAPLPDNGIVRPADSVPLPELSELDVVRHFVRLSQKNMAIDTNFYPLGSCTMKYNPKVNEKTAGLPGFTNLHPLQDAEMAQGAMQLLFELQIILAEISGFAAVTLQPAAGAHGELTGVLIMRKYHLDRGDTPSASRSWCPTRRTAPTRPPPPWPACRWSSCPRTPRQRRSGRAQGQPGRHRGRPDADQPQHAGPVRGARAGGDAVGARGGRLVYGDGANLNAIVGVARPGDLGIDVMHFNLHKTFSTPHGGGGPGAGPVAVVEKLAPFLPGPLVAVEKVETTTWPARPRRGGDDHEHDGYRLVWHTPSKSIGRVRSYYGNFGVLVRAYTYIRMHGAEGLRRIAENAVLNANYLKARCRPRARTRWPTASGRACTSSWPRASSTARPTCTPWTSPSG